MFSGGTDGEAVDTMTTECILREMGPGSIPRKAEIRTHNFTACRRGRAGKAVASEGIESEDELLPIQATQVHVKGSG